MVTSKINCVVIGVQKAGTSSYYNWIAQHPQIFGASAAKDFAYFANDKLYKQGEQLIQPFYTEYAGEKIVMQGHVNDILFPKALQRIKDDCSPDLKLIVVLRDPVKRTISSYEYFHKLGIEDNNFETAVQKDLNNYYTEYKDVKDKTYVSHGMYYKQLAEVFKIFTKEQVHVVIFEEMVKSPANSVRGTFEFLNVDPTFAPDFKLVNETGSPRFRLINKFLFRENRLKNLVKNNKLFNMILPYSRRIEMRKKITALNTVSKQKKEKYDTAFLYDLFKDDINKLEKLLDVNLDVWRKYEG